MSDFDEFRALQMSVVLEVLSEASPCVGAAAVASGAGQAGFGSDQKVGDMVIESPALIE
jgi:hypothetical protein